MVWVTRENSKELAHQLAEKAKMLAGKPTDAEILERDTREALGIPDPDTDVPEHLPDPDTIIPVEPVAIDPQEINDSIEESTDTSSVGIQISPTEEKTMDNSFPKYQYSVFLNGSRDEQLVIRADTFEEFQQLKADANSILAWTTPRAVVSQPAPAPVAPPPAAQPQYAPPQPTAPVQSPLQAVVCPKCGSGMWDNRGRKTNPKAPDFKCKDKNCDGAIWPPRR